MGSSLADDTKLVQLKESTLLAFVAYIRNAEAAMEQTLHEEPFLWSEAVAERAQAVRKGKVVAQLWSEPGQVTVPDGLIHDWIGAAFIAGKTVSETLALVQDYDNHKNIYKPEVIASALVARQDNDFRIYLRLLKKKIITVVLDTDHDVHYSSLDPQRWCCRSYTTRIAEVEAAGSAKEKVLPPDTGHGYLWRLYSYWRFQETHEGVHIQCRAISLSRDVPSGLGWIVHPIIGKLPRESLIHTLTATRQALSSRRIEASGRAQPTDKVPAG